MKTLDQIIRYTYQCSFSEDDWSKVLAYCRKHFKGKKLRKSATPISKSTYNQFLDWINSGFGSGDLVSYGNTVGVIGDCTPQKTILIAYCDYEGNLIVKNMDVQEVSRLKILDKKRGDKLKKKIYNKGFDIDRRTAKMVELYVPKENFYTTFGDIEHDDLCVGIYLESDGCLHHFSAILDAKNRFKLDCWVELECTPFRPATEKDIHRLHRAASNMGLYFNGRTNTFIKVAKRGHDNIYWYLNDRFEILLDRDNGSQKHTERYEAGNYFTDNTEALLFMKMIRDMRRGG